MLSDFGYLNMKNLIICLLFILLLIIFLIITKKSDVRCFSAHVMKKQNNYNYVVKVGLILNAEIT